MTDNKWILENEKARISFIQKYHPAHPTKKTIADAWYTDQKSAWMAEAIEQAKRRKSPEVVTRIHPFDTYDIVCGYCYNDTGNPLPDVIKYIVAELTKRGLEIDEYLADSFGPEVWPVFQAELPPEKNLARIIVYYVTGGSEGHYVHVDYTTRDNMLHTIFFIKTEGMERAREFVSALSDIIDV